MAETPNSSNERVNQSGQQPEETSKRERQKLMEQSELATKSLNYDERLKLANEAVASRIADANKKEQLKSLLEITTEARLEAREHVLTDADFDLLILAVKQNVKTDLFKHPEGLTTESGLLNKETKQGLELLTVLGQFTISQRAQILEKLITKNQNNPRYGLTIAKLFACSQIVPPFIVQQIVDRYFNNQNGKYSELIQAISNPEELIDPSDPKLKKYLELVNTEGAAKLNNFGVNAEKNPELVAVKNIFEKDRHWGGLVGMVYGSAQAILQGLLAFGATVRAFNGDGDIDSIAQNFALMLAGGMVAAASVELATSKDGSESGLLYDFVNRLTTKQETIDEHGRYTVRERAITYANQSRDANALYANKPMQEAIYNSTRGEQWAKIRYYLEKGDASPLIARLNSELDKSNNSGADDLKQKLASRYRENPEATLTEILFFGLHHELEQTGVRGGDVSQVLDNLNYKPA